MDSLPGSAFIAGSVRMFGSSVNVNVNYIMQMA